MNMSKMRLVLLASAHKAPIFAGVFARDDFMRLLTPGPHVVNTENSDQSGEHWVVSYIDGHHYNFFDSYGRQPSSFSVFRQRLSCLVCRFWNDYLIYCLTTNACGDYSVSICSLLAQRFALPFIVRLLIITRAEVRDHLVRGFLIHQFEPNAVTDLRSALTFSLEKVHVLPLQSSCSLL